MSFGRLKATVARANALPDREPAPTHDRVAQFEIFCNVRSDRRFKSCNFRLNHERRLVDQNRASWNPMVVWLRRLALLKATVRVD